jgi:hypothetical protein
MAQVREHYPYRCTDEEIKELIHGYSKEIYDSRANINTVLAMSPLLQLGLQELQSRQNKNITYLSLGVSTVSLIVSAVTLYVSLCQ